MIRTKRSKAEGPPTNANADEVPFFAVQLRLKSDPDALVRPSFESGHRDALSCGAAVRTSGKLSSGTGHAERQKRFLQEYVFFFVAGEGTVRFQVEAILYWWWVEAILQGQVL